MTIALSNSNPVQYAGNGVATSFTYPWKISASTDLVVGFIVGGTYTQQTAGYTVSGVGNNGGGSVNFTIAPPNGTTVDLRPLTPFTQPTEFANLAAYLPENTTNAADRLTRSVQDLCRLTYTFGIHGPDSESAVWTALPIAVARANTALMFDGNGLPTVGVLTSSALTQSQFNNFLAGSPGVQIAQTAAEQAAGVTPTNLTYQPYNILRYGGDPTGVSPSDTALANAISVCGATGGTILLPNGRYQFASQIALNVKIAPIILKGDGGASAGSGTGTQMFYTGTASPWMNWNSSVGIELRDIQVYHTNPLFTGTYIKCSNDGVHSDPAWCAVRHCCFGAAPNGVGNIHLDLDKCQQFTVEGCNFANGNGSISLCQPGSYANSIRIRDTQFVNSYSAPIQGGGQGVDIRGCVFEGAGAIANTPAVAISNSASAYLLGFVFEANWLGDSGTAAGAWLNIYAQGAKITGNYFSGNATASSAITLNGSFGVGIEDNVISTFLNGITFATSNNADITVKGNVANSVTNPWVNPALAVVGTLEVGPNFGFPAPTGHGNPLAANGYRINADGTIEQWGLFSTATSSGTLTFATNGGIAFPNACYQVQMTLSSVGSTTDTIFSGPVSTTGVTYTIGGTFTNPTSFFWRAIGR